VTTHYAFLAYTNQKPIPDFGGEIRSVVGLVYWNKKGGGTESTPNAIITVYLSGAHKL
jgi:hypothetical protein